MEKFKTIKDKYKSARGGHSKFLNIYCEHCGTHICLYQKDGPGALKRMYMDRIRAPKDVSSQEENLFCPGCKRLIAVPTIYEKEKRKAYGLLAYTIIKKPGKGIYPPEVSKLEV